MKKKIAPKRSAASVKKTAPKKSRGAQSSVITYQRIIIFGAIVLAFVGIVSFNKPAVTQSVAGVSIAKGLFSQATVEIPRANGAVGYNIYYKKVGDNVFNNAVRSIPGSSTSYTISYLTKGAQYEYKVAAVDTRGKEFWFGPTQALQNIKSM